jgi:hypothetical protein
VPIGRTSFGTRGSQIQILPLRPKSPLLINGPHTCKMVSLFARAQFRAQNGPHQSRRGRSVSKNARSTQSSPPRCGCLPGARLRGMGVRHPMGGELGCASEPFPQPDDDKLYVGAGQTAVLRYEGNEVRCHTLQEAKSAWDKLSSNQKATATIRVKDRQYTPAQIDRMYYRRKPSSWDVR